MFGLRGSPAHRGNPFAIVVAAAELDLEQRPPGGALGGRRHLRYRGQRDRISGNQRPRFGDSGQFVGATALLPGVNVPVSTIECITGGTGGQGLLQSVAVEAPPQRRTDGLDCRHNAVRSFAVTCVGDGLAAAAVGPIAEFSYHDDGFGLAAAADRESAGYRPALDPYGELHAGSTMTAVARPTQVSQWAPAPAAGKKP